MNQGLLSSEFSICLGCAPMTLEEMEEAKLYLPCAFCHSPMLDVDGHSAGLCLSCCLPADDELHAIMLAANKCRECGQIKARQPRSAHGAT